jgi:hypothetical protein
LKLMMSILRVQISWSESQNTKCQSGKYVKWERLPWSARDVRHPGTPAFPPKWTISSQIIPGPCLQNKYIVLLLQWYPKITFISELTRYMAKCMSCVFMWKAHGSYINLCTDIPNQSHQ